MASVLLTLSLLMATFRFQAAQAGKPTQENITNAMIIELHRLGLGDSVILEKIQSARCDFDTSLEGLKKLKAAGLSDAVLAAMVHASVAGFSSTDAATVTLPARDPDDPLAPHDPGIYYVEDGSGKSRLIRIEPTVYTQAKSGGFLASAMTYGIAKVKSKAVLSGSNAQHKIWSHRPTLYFYFDVQTSSLSNSGASYFYFNAATSPSEFLLARVGMKKNSRELVVGKSNAFGAQGGVEDSATRPFDSEKVAPGIFKVRPRADLPDGEYAFFYGGNGPTTAYGFHAPGLVGPAGSGKVFDFGIWSK